MQVYALEQGIQHLSPTPGRAAAHSRVQPEQVSVVNAVFFEVLHGIIHSRNVASIFVRYLQL